MTSKLVSEWKCTTAWTAGKCMTGLSRRCDVIPKFSPAWDPPHSPLCKVSALWTLRAPLTSALPVTHWFSPDCLSKFNSPPPRASSAPALSGKDKLLIVLQTEDTLDMIFQLNFTWGKQTEYGTGRERNNRLVYRRAGRVNSRSSLACFSLKQSPSLIPVPVITWSPMLNVVASKKT